MGRIIPARAGFTVRSRLPVSSSNGSSPLARGLQLHTFPQVMANRIIPARAGFTDRGRGARAGGGDHPRSRGVYGGVVGRAERCAGSSPLARGLHQTGHLIAPVRGIIPARTGFTSLWRPCRLPWLDHPRSRGVYRTVRRRQFALAGSSPLARGLPGEVAHGAFGARIIPARAGFTGAS